jgi:ubiquinone/menaquinone biosynthesis C-methylase UbiE
MANPWLDIPLADYEGHMALPAVGQAKMLAGEFEALLRTYCPNAVAVIGCAGGNGFDQVNDAGVVRLVGIDINARYIAAAKRRYSSKIRTLELYCADIQDELPAIGQVDLVYAALVFEYVNLKLALKNIRKLCLPQSRLVALLQVPSQSVAAVSPSPFASTQGMASIMRLIPPLEFRTAAEKQGFAFVLAKTIALPSGKQFSLQVFKLNGKC